MAISNTSDLINQKLRDPNFLSAAGPVTAAQINAVREALKDIAKSPESLKKYLLDPNQKIVLGTAESIKTQFGQDLSRSNGRYQPGRIKNGFWDKWVKGEKFTHTGQIFLNTDGRDAERIGRTLRHEIGHAYDRIQGGGANYGSLKSENFKNAADQYIGTLGTMPKATKEFAYQRDFKDHLRFYEGKPINTAYLELSAEMFGNFFGVADKHGVVYADKYMSDNFPKVWDVYKTEVKPSIGETISRHRNAVPNNKIVVHKPTPKIPDAKPATTVPTLSTAEIRRDSALLKHFGGEKSIGIGVRSNGDLRLEVPKSYSRSNLAKFGIEDTASLKRMGSVNNGKAIIHIPQDQLPKNLQIDYHAAGQLGALADADIISDADFSAATANNAVKDVDINTNKYDIPDELRIELNNAKSMAAGKGMTPEYAELFGLKPDGTPIPEPRSALEHMGLKEHVGHTPIKTTFNLSESITNTNLWQEAVTNGGEKISRIPVGDFDASDIARLEKTLIEAGLKPVRRTSSTLGDTIRVSGADIDKLKDIQGGLHSAKQAIDDGLHSAGNAVDSGLHTTKTEVDGIAQQWGREAADANVGGSHWTEKLSSPWVQVGIGAAVGIGTVMFTDATWEEGAGVAFQTAMPFGEVITEAASGDVDGTIKAAATEVSGMAGAIVGAKAGAGFGAWAGGTVGAFFGVVGAVPGAAIGGTVGGIIGSIAGGIGFSAGTNYVMTTVPEITETIKYAGEETLEYAGVDTDDLYDGYKTATSYIVAGKDWTFAAIDSGYETLAGMFNDESGTQEKPVLDISSTDIKLAELRGEESVGTLSASEAWGKENSSYSQTAYWNNEHDHSNITVEPLGIAKSSEFDSYQGDVTLLQEAFEQLGINIDQELLQQSLKQNEQSPTISSPLFETFNA